MRITKRPPQQLPSSDAAPAWLAASTPELREAYSAAKTDKERNAVLVRVIQSMQSGAPEGSAKPHSLRFTSASNVPSKGQQFAADVREALDRLIVGQDLPKQAVVTALRASPPGRAKRPTVLAITGPSGVGKTDFAKAICEVLHGEGVKPITLEGAMFKNDSDISVLEGSAPGYVGFGESSEKAPISNENIAQTFKGKKPAVFLIDEIDDIDPKVRSAFWSKLNKAFDEGYFRLKNGDTVDIEGALFVITSNAGLNTVGNLKGEAAAAHYASAFETAIPEKKILNRIGRSNIIPCDTLTVDDLETIVGSRFIAPDTKRYAKEALAERGIDVRFDLSDEALKLICEMTHSDETGARTARQFVDRIVLPMLDDALASADDDNTIRLDVRPGMTDVERNKTIATFQKMKGMPPDMTVESSPIVATVQRSNRVFEAYEGTIPLSETAAPLVHASGAFAGDGFLLFNAGEGASVNELLLLQDGATEAMDRMRRVALPEELAQSNLAMNAVAVSPHELLVVGFGAPADGTEAVSSAAIYDAKAKTWTKVEAPPLALVGASLAGANGKVILTGGRPVYHDGEFWSVHVPGAEDAAGFNYDNGAPSQSEAWAFDSATRSWTSVDSAPQSARTGMATATVGDKVYFFGGEESIPHPNGTMYTRVSSAVDVYDTTTNTFTKGAALPVAMAHTTAVVDHENGKIMLMGGADLIDGGRVWTTKDTVVSIPLTLDRSGVDESKRVKVRSHAMPAEAAQLACVPRGAEHVVGPFVAEDGSLAFATLK